MRTELSRMKGGVVPTATRLSIRIKRRAVFTGARQKERDWLA
ncbi:MAG TPA: hypothetical protein VGX92_22545 [Pyrinomonadaceae bacterium]|nr:hypothetical protein [Pyrinomonadaceae bacterium]